MREAGAAHGRIREHRHAHQRGGLQRAEDAADGQPVGRNTHPVVVVRRAQDAGDEDQAHDHVEPLLHHLAVGAGQADQQVGQEAALDHDPHALDPEVDRPPAVVDGDGVVFVFQQRGQVQQRGQAEAEHEHTLRGGEAFGAPDRHADVVEKDQHADHDDDLVRQGLFQQLVAGAVAEQVAHHGGHAHQGPEAQLHVGEFGAVELGTRFVGHHPVGGAHEAGEHPHDQQVGVDHLGHIERQDVQQRIGAEVLGGRQQAKHQLQPEQHHGHGEIPVGNRLRPVAHVRTPAEVAAVARGLCGLDGF
ncbi:hypothetical protein Y695_03568 [Hydrogenophaga sp. T4]|nr:hypothetical protein Y695_03568 [Hydrogenophaga sp. T4]